MPARQFLHLVNPVAAPPASDLYAAQPVTFAALRDARRFAAEHGGIQAHLCAVGYPEDAPAIPPDFHRLPDLTRSMLDVGRFRRPRRLPLVADLIARAVEAADGLGAETLVYTNVDIAPMPDFYVAVAALLDAGHDALSITRRTLPKTWPNGVADLPLMRAQVGQPHPGRDCFVFAREAARRYTLGLACIGVGRVGKVLAANLLCHSANFAEFKDLHLTFHLGDDQPWQSGEFSDYTAHNERELRAVLHALLADGLGSLHPLWQKLLGRLEGKQTLKN